LLPGGNEGHSALPREVEVEARADAALIKSLMRRTAHKPTPRQLLPTPRDDETK
jgi:hypothetical protein